VGYINYNNNFTSGSKCWTVVYGWYFLKVGRCDVGDGIVWLRECFNDIALRCWKLFVGMEVDISIFIHVII